MRNLKRVLTLVMAVAMMMSLLVVGAGAAFPDQDKIENTDAVNMNVALGIIKGRDTGVFDPTGNVTRAEMAKMICITLNGGNEPTVGVKATATFKDIKGHWAEGYIEYCAALGIVAGMGDGTFAPNANVTGTQAAKMLLVALGYDAAFEGFNGTSWAVKINVAASQKALYDELAIDPNAALNRDNAAQMVWNALNAKEVKYDYSLTTVNGQLMNIQKREDKTTDMLASKFKSDTLVGQLAKFSYNSTKKEWTYTIDPATGPDQTFTTKTDFTGLYGQDVKVVFKTNSDKTVYGMHAQDSEVLFSGVVDDMDIKTDSIKFDGKTYDLATTNTATKAHNFVYNVTFNLAGANATALNALSATQATYSFKAIDEDGNGKVNFLIIYPYEVKEVTFVGSKTITAGTSYTIADCDVYSGIKKDDYTKITDKAYTATNTTQLEKVDKMVSGKVNSRTGGTYYIDGTGYVLAPGVTMNVGDTVKDAAVVNGFIFAADTSGTTKVEDYAVVMSAQTASGVNGHQAKLIFADGTKKVVDTDVSYDNATYLGKMVTFEINSDKDYELTLVTYPANGAGTGFDAGNTGGAIANSDNGTTSGKAKFINGWNIADDAVIFIKNSDNSYQVITGSKFLTTSIGNGAPYFTLKGAFANKASSTGYNTVKLAFIENSGANLTSADSLYGYAVKDNGQEKNDKNQTVYTYTLWNGKQEVKLFAKQGLNTAVTKGQVAKYALNSDGYVDTITTYATTGVSHTAVAISAYDGKYIQLNGTSTRYEIDKDDTVIIYVDNKDKKGVEGGSIQLANKATDGSYIPNAIVLTTGTDVDLIVLDTRNDMTDAIVAVGNAAADTQAELTALFNSNNTVIVAGNYSPAEAITIPAGKTLSVTGDLVAGANNVTKAHSSATVTVAGAVTASTATVQVNTAASVTTTGAATVTASGNIGTVTANAAGATINANGTITTITANAGTINATGAITTITANAGTINATGAITTITANATGTINAYANITTVTANGGTINVKDNLTITTLTANAGTIAVDTTKTLTITNTTAIAVLESITLATNAKLTLSAASTGNASATTWYTKTGKAQTIAPNDGAGAIAINGAVVPAGTYVYGTLGFSDDDQAVADLTGFFKFPLVAE